MQFFKGFRKYKQKFTNRGKKLRILMKSGDFAKYLLNNLQQILAFYREFKQFTHMHADSQTFLT